MAATSAMHLQGPPPALQQLAFPACKDQQKRQKTIKSEGKTSITSTIDIQSWTKMTEKAQKLPKSNHQPVYCVMHSDNKQKDGAINKINVALVTCQELLMRVNCKHTPLSWCTAR